MPRFDFVSGTVTPGGIDFVNMTPEQLADKLREGVPAAELKQLANAAASDAAGQAMLGKYTELVLNLAIKAVADGSGVGSLLAAFKAS